MVIMSVYIYIYINLFIDSFIYAFIQTHSLKVISCELQSQFELCSTCQPVVHWFVVRFTQELGPEQVPQPPLNHELILKMALF